MKTEKQFLLSDKSFPLIVGMLCAALIAGTNLYILHNVGAFNEIFVVKILDEGLNHGEYAAAAAFAVGFLIARVLEAPLVGLLDIGGALMTGVGIGIPALILSFQNPKLDNLIYNFSFSLLVGFLVGAIIGAIIIAIRKAMPSGMSASGTGIMMGAGNATGRFLGPLIILSSANYSVETGIGAIAGAAIFYHFNRPIAGGAIIGAMTLGGIMVYL